MRKNILIGLAFIFLLPFKSLAYSIPTHAYLTSEIFDLYNRSFDGKIDVSAKPYLLDGARREDDQFRPLNHFYDPVHDVGFHSQALGEWPRSKDWAVTEALQNKSKYKAAATVASILTAVQQRKLSLISSESDFSWQKGIRAYARGDKEKAFFILGHILHLVEDMSVPDHTRNDPHPASSPYEDWTAQFTLESPDKKLDTARPPVILGDLSAYFTGLAKYSNENFYSDDTIGIQSGFDGPQPDVFEKNGDFILGINTKTGENIKLYTQPATQNILVKTKREIVFNDKNILADYWSHLAPKAIQYGAGVVDLFIEEGEKAKLDPNFDKTEPSSLVGEIVSAMQNLAGEVNRAVQYAFGNKEDKKEPPTPSPMVVPEIPTNILVPPATRKADATLQVPKKEPAPPPALAPGNAAEKTIPESAFPAPAELPAAPEAPRFIYVGGGGAPPEPIVNTSPAPIVPESSSTVSTSSVPVIIPPTPTSTATSTPEEPEASTTVLRLVETFFATTTPSGVHFEWTPASTSSDLVFELYKESGSTSLLYAGTSTAFEYESDSGAEESFRLSAGMGALVESTTTLAWTPNPIGKLRELQFVPDSNTRVLRITARVFGFSPDKQSVLALELLPADEEFSGITNYQSPGVLTGETAEISIPQFRGGSFHWKYKVAEFGGPNSGWSEEQSGDILMADLPIRASGNFTSAYRDCGTHIIPAETFELTSVEYFAGCANGTCAPPNTFQIIAGDMSRLLAESDGSSIGLSVDPGWIWENFTGANAITLNAGESYFVTPYSANGYCTTDPYHDPQRTFYLH